MCYSIASDIEQDPFKYDDPKDHQWKTKTGQILEISEMTDGHIVNTIRMLERSAENIEAFCFAAMPDSISYDHILYGDNYSPEILLRENPQYNSLKQEAKKRNLKI